MTIVIEKNIPVSGNPPKKPGLAVVLRALEVGDSFLSPASMSATHSAIQSFKRSSVNTFAVRKTADGYRVWRTA
jgi:hypothetical protein